MYAKNPAAKRNCPLSVGVPGELARVHLAWTQHGKMPWKRLVQPVIKLAAKGFSISPYLASNIKKHKKAIMADKGLTGAFTINGKLLSASEEQ